MNREEAVKITESSIQELQQSMIDGNGAMFRVYLETLARFTQYSHRNIFLLLKQFPSAKQVAGFATWKQKGRKVRAGEKGIGIIAPLILRPTKEHREDPHDATIRFRIVHVFDISQTVNENGLDESPIEPAMTDLLDLMEGVYRNLGIYLETTTSMGGVDGVSYGGRVKIAERLKAEERFQVLAHELAHELLHVRDSKSSNSLPKVIRELEAEAIAFVVSKANGIGSLDESSAYIQGYGGDTKLLEASLETIRKTSIEILKMLDEVKLSTSVEARHAA